MTCKPRMQELLAILCTLGTFGALAQAQTVSSPNPAPELVPSTLITDGAPSFHLGQAGRSVYDTELPADTTTANQGSSQTWSVSGAIKRTLQDQKEIWTAPLHRKNIKWDALFVAGTATLVAVDEQVLHALPNTQVSTSSNVSNALIIGEGAALGGIFFIRGLHGGDSHAKETGIIGMEALANTFLVYVPLQLVAGRQRPNEGSGEGNFFVNHSVNTSFPGGHTMFAFSMATVIAHEYPRWWVQLLSYGAASAITGARMTAKDHFPSDLLVGGALGYLIGTHVFHSRCNPDLGGDCHSRDKEGP